MKKNIIFILALIIAVGSLAAIVNANNEDSGKWKKMNSVYLVNNTTKLLYEDKYDEYFSTVNEALSKNNSLKIDVGNDKESNNYLSDKEIIDKVAKDFKIKKIKYSNDIAQEITSYDYEIELEGKTMYFETFELNGKMVIQNKPFSDTPAVTFTKDGNRFVFEYNLDLYSIDPYTLKIKKLTKDSYVGKSKDEFLEYNSSLYWAANPNLSPDGSNLVYYSNKYVEGENIVFGEGLWLYSFNEDRENILITSFEISNGYSLGSYINWISNEEFIYETYENIYGTPIKYIKYNIKTGNQEVVLELNKPAKFQEGFFVYSDDNSITAYDALNNKEYEFNIENTSNITDIAISSDGKVAVPYNNSIAILDINTKNVITYNLPKKADNYVVQGWIDNDNLIIFQRDYKMKNSWILNIGGEF